MSPIITSFEVYDTSYKVQNGSELLELTKIHMKLDSKYTYHRQPHGYMKTQSFNIHQEKIRQMLNLEASQVESHQVDMKLVEQC